MALPKSSETKKVTSIFKEKKIKINNYENKLAKIFTKNIKEI